MVILLAIVVVIYYILLHFKQPHEPILTELYTAGRQSTFRKACILNSTVNEINIQARNMSREIAYRKLNL